MNVDGESKGGGIRVFRPARHSLGAGGRSSADKKKREGSSWRVALVLALVLFGLAGAALAADGGPAGGVAQDAGPAIKWSSWALALFVLSLAIGFVSVLAGSGGGVLFVPLLAGFFPFHLDFVRGAGILVALSSALAASPRLFRSGLVSLRLAMPAALVASIFSLLGARLGFALPEATLRIALGLLILGVVLIMLAAGRLDYPDVKQPDWLARLLKIRGHYNEPTRSEKETVHWQIHRTPLGLAAFSLVGLIAGMFGMGAGWANVPVLNLVMGAPLKLAVATSVFLLSITDTAAAWAYLHNGAVLPIIAVPCVVGVMIGSRMGAAVLTRMRPGVIRVMFIVILLLAGVRTLLRGLGV